jgi:Cdc6-like AAA superfamily ATPase
VILQAASEQKVSVSVLAIDTIQSDGPPFVGRRAELDRLSEMLAPADRGTSIAVVTGPPGVGKTALTKQAAMSVHGAGWFTHALFVDMRGYEVDPSNRARREDVYLSLLRRLGVRNDDIPANPGDQGTLYSQIIDQLAADGKPVLLWLDNVSDSSQFELLRPAGSVHRLVVTTREAFASPTGLSSISMSLTNRKQSNF